MVADLLTRLPLDPSAWTEISSRFSVTLGIGVRVAGENRDVVLSKDVVPAAGMLGASVWVDIYCMNDNDAQDPATEH